MVISFMESNRNKIILYDYLSTNMNDLEIENKIIKISHDLYKFRKRYPILPYIANEIKTFFEIGNWLDDESLFWMQFFIFNYSFPHEELEKYLQVQSLPATETGSKSILSLLKECNLIEKNRDQFKMRYSITPFKGYYFLSDFPKILNFFNCNSERDNSAVYTPMPDSFDLATELRVKEGDKVLDLCTGTGIQAFIESKYASSVIASDINKRAISLATENVILNLPQHPYLKKISFRCGSLFDALAEKDFNFISANMPSLPNLPLRTFGNALYGIGGGLDGLDLFKAFMLKLPDKLAHKGIAQIWGIFPFDGNHYNFENYIPNGFKWTRILTHVYKISLLLNTQNQLPECTKASLVHYHSMKYENFHELILNIRK